MYIDSVEVFEVRIRNTEISTAFNIDSHEFTDIVKITALLWYGTDVNVSCYLPTALPYKFSISIFYYTMQRVSADQINHRQVDVGYTKRNIKEERSLLTLLRIITVLFQKGVIRLKLIHNHVTEFVRYNL
jgi:hypothetical protein